MRQVGLRADSGAGIACAPPQPALASDCPNRLATLPALTKPNQVWVSDLTYVPTDEGWLYVAGVLDRCSRCLVCWAMGSTLDTAVPLAALMMALRQRRPRQGLIHHSDRGAQYASADYRSAARRPRPHRLDEPPRQLLR